MRASHILLAFTLLITLSAPSMAIVEEDVSFESPKTEKRYKKLIAELRCLVCQNQNLAESDAELAKDLRKKTVDMLKDGASDNDVRTYMRDRYGDFILYKPPFNLSTAFIWLSPFLLLAVVLVGIVFHLRKRQHDELLKPTQAEKNNQARIKIRNLLKESPTLNTDTNSTPNSTQPPTKK